MERWTTQHRAFVVEAYFKDGDSVVKTQRLFRTHFNIPGHGCVPCRNTIKAWVQNFRESASALKSKPKGRGTDTRKC
jgi:transposase-like protein